MRAADMHAPQGIDVDESTVGLHMADVERLIRVLKGFMTERRGQWWLRVRGATASMRRHGPRRPDNAGRRGVDTSIDSPGEGGDTFNAVVGVSVCRQRFAVVQKL